jgi:hypothetical protein
MGFDHGLLTLAPAGPRKDDAHMLTVISPP